MENLYILILAFVAAVILGRIIIPNILIISLRKRLFDEPNERKIHKRPVPRLGGVTFSRSSSSRSRSSRRCA